MVQPTEELMERLSSPGFWGFTRHNDGLSSYLMHLSDSDVSDLLEPLQHHLIAVKIPKKPDLTCNSKIEGPNWIKPLFHVHPIDRTNISATHPL